MAAMRSRALRVLALGILFAGSAAASFAIARPTLASAAIRAVPGSMCKLTNPIVPGGGGGFDCGVPTGSDVNDGLFSRYYFDFYPSASNAQLVATKTSTSGSYYQDYLMVAVSTLTPSVPNERGVNAVNTKLAPSSWDYITLKLQGVDGTLGVGVLTN